jgi:hypothetical protein
MQGRTQTSASVTDSEGRQTVQILIDNVEMLSVKRILPEHACYLPTRIPNVTHSKMHALRGGAGSKQALASLMPSADAVECYQ